MVILPLNEIVAETVLQEKNPMDKDSAMALASKCKESDVLSQYGSSYFFSREV